MGRVWDVSGGNEADTRRHLWRMPEEEEEVDRARVRTKMVRNSVYLEQQAMVPSRDGFIDFRIMRGFIIFIQVTGSKVLADWQTS